ncbi:Major facilitator superfamily transporter [Acididesulfobacillus acetoxydans]|uniref:Major facilitator super MFS 1 n=1 Tax=Acididesulfobacillus acetoxydans TaxID=1561005 RepID=A0A8S0WGK8_9FIRM|nr:MFS transporter [Acididesulfobacillus acetoxydans]CAA7601972.1 Major facilitator superfamily transporter [Acididesulfobacillus acetoxydans]CEJ08184.1 Major facilitator super MFS 1 [Acididesulfobacillus acetoxydans]
MSGAGLKGRVSRVFPALKQRNFRYFWLGQCISLIGSWIQTTAQQWLVYTMTKSALLLGLLGVAQFGPIMLLSLFAGVFVDRYPKKRMLIFTQTCLTIQALVLAVLVWLGHIAYWEVLLLAAFMGLVNTLDLPTRQSLLPQLVPKKDLRSAIGLNSAIVNVARILGPALAALLMVQFGAGFLFFLNAISFIPVLVGLHLIKLKPENIINAEKRVLAGVRDGLAYIHRSSILLGAVFSMLAIGTFVMNFSVVIPLYAVEVLKRGIHGYAFLLSASGTGSLLGALLVASWAKGNPRLRLLLGSAFLVSGLLLFLRNIHTLPLAIGMFVMIGFVNIIFITTANSTVQLNTEDRYRGRVMSVYSFAFSGTTPIGNLFAGAVTQWWGAGMGFFLCGAASAFFLLLTVLGLGLKLRKRSSFDRSS